MEHSGWGAIRPGGQNTMGPEGRCTIGPVGHPKLFSLK